MLKALARWILREEAPETHQRPSAAIDYESEVRRIVVRELEKTREELDSRMKKLVEQVEWEMSEWYEKFSTLHARTAKRAQREAQQKDPSAPVGVPDAVKRSVLSFRRLGSP